MFDNQNEFQLIEPSIGVMVTNGGTNGFSEEVGYGAVAMMDKPNSMAEFLAYDEDLLEDAPWMESPLLDYRQRNEMC